MTRERERAGVRKLEKNECNGRGDAELGEWKRKVGEWKRNCKRKSRERERDQR